MKLSEVWKTGYSANNKRKKLVNVLIPTAILSLTLVFITFYGMNTGNFTVGVDEEAYQRNISISTMPESKENLKSVYVNSKKILPNDFYIIDSILDNVIETDGEYGGDFSRNLLAYTFYLKNESLNISFDLDYTIIVKDIASKNEQVKFAKVMFIIDGEKRIYQSGESTKTDYPNDYKVTNYLEGKEIVKDRIFDLKAQTERKVTIVFWYEGSEIKNYEDSEMENLKLQVNFKIVD